MGKKGTASFTDIIESNFSGELTERYKDAVVEWEQEMPWSHLPTIEENDARCDVLGVKAETGMFDMHYFILLLAHEFILKMAHYRPLEPVVVDGKVQLGYHVSFALWEPTEEDPVVGWAHMGLDDDLDNASVAFSLRQEQLPDVHELFLRLYEAMHGELLAAGFEAAEAQKDAASKRV